MFEFWNDLLHDKETFVSFSLFLFVPLASFLVLFLVVKFAKYEDLNKCFDDLDELQKRIDLFEEKVK